MGLLNLKKEPINYTNSIAAKIQQRRYQILVHSFLYYQLDEPIVDDYKWSLWAQELIDLQNKYPDISKKVKYAEEFKDFTAPTGLGLDYNKPEIKNIAYRLLEGR